MTYTITPEQVASVTDVEAAFSCTRLLPKMADIPQEFFKGTIHTRVVSAMFFGSEIPENDLVLKDGFNDAKAFHKCIRAHLGSFDPKHEHKIAGVGYMLSLITESRADCVARDNAAKEESPK